MLDLSAAFDTIDHTILLKRLKSSFGITNTSLSWLESYLSDQSQCVAIEGVASKKSKLIYGVPQGSVLGPVLFTLYSKPLSDVIMKHNLQFHKYADDTELSSPDKHKYSAIFFFFSIFFFNFFSPNIAGRGLKGRISKIHFFSGDTKN